MESRHRWRHLAAALGPCALLATTQTAQLATAGAKPRATVTALVGAGSTFDYPFFRIAFAAYSARSGVPITYQSIGSGAGIQRFIDNRVDFGASDVPMDPRELALAVLDGSGVAQVPVALGGIAIAYNLPGVSATLGLDGPALVGIYRGAIVWWDDPAIAALNPSVALPHMKILPVHRSDGSGTTYITTDYLSAVSTTWSETPGRGKLLTWPTGVGATGNAGVAAVLKERPGPIGYLELSNAIDNGIPYAALKNRAGMFVLPTLESIPAAGTQFPDINARHYSIVDPDGPTSYPISGYSWGLLRRHPKANGPALVALFRWLTSSGQHYAPQVHNVPLPPNVQLIAATILSSMSEG